jgi:hypothetical protein
MIIKFEIVDGVLIGPYPENFLIDLPLAKQIVAERLAFVGDKSYPALIDTTEVAGITKEARDYFSSEEAVKGISIAAIVSKSLFTVFLANFLVGVNLKRTPIPMKVFRNREDAISWLKASR